MSGKYSVVAVVPLNTSSDDKASSVITQKDTPSLSGSDPDQSASVSASVSAETYWAIYTIGIDGITGWFQQRQTADKYLSDRARHGYVYHPGMGVMMNNDGVTDVIVSIDCKTTPMMASDHIIRYCKDRNDPNYDNMMKAVLQVMKDLNLRVKGKWVRMSPIITGSGMCD